MKVKVTIDLDVKPDKCPLLGHACHAIHDANGFLFRVAPSQSIQDALRAALETFETARFEITGS